MYHPSESEVKRKTTQHARFQIETDLNVLKEDQVMKIALQSDSEEQLYAIGEEQAERCLLYTSRSKIYSIFKNRQSA